MSSLPKPDILNTTEGNLNPLSKIEKYVLPISTVPIEVQKDKESDPYVYQADIPLPIGSGPYSDQGKKFFGQVVSQETKNADGYKKISLKTRFLSWSSGRADVFLPMIFRVLSKVAGAKDHVMTTIIRKGSGSIKALEEEQSPFATGKDEREGDIEGSSSIADLQLDAKNSNELEAADIRTRLPLAIYRVVSFPFQGEKLTPDQLLERGIVAKKEDLPGIGIFAQRSALRMEDLETVFGDEDINSPAVEATIKYLVDISKFDDDPGFHAFYEKYALQSEWPENEKLNAIFDYMKTAATLFGKQAAKFEKIGKIKTYNKSISGRAGAENPGNETSHCESVDNSELTPCHEIEKTIVFQQSLLLMVRSVGPKGIGQTVVDVRNDCSTMFVSSYLDEINPGWKEEILPEKFTDLINSMHLKPETSRVAWTLLNRYQNALQSQYPDEPIDLEKLLQVFDVLGSYVLEEHPSLPDKAVLATELFLELQKETVDQMGARKIA